MFARLDADVFHREFQLLFIAVNRLVLRAVIAERPLHVGNQAHERHIRDENEDAQHALQQISAPVRRAVRQKAGHERRKQDKQPDCETHADENGQEIQHGFHQPVTEAILEPLLQLGRLLVLLVLQQNFRRIINRLKALNQRLHHEDKAADDRHTGNFMRFLERRIGLFLYGKSAVRPAHDRARPTRSLHHDAF